MYTLVNNNILSSVFVKIINNFGSEKKKSTLFINNYIQKYISHL